MSSGRAVQEWRNRTLAEYRSAAVTAQLLHWLVQAGMPDAHLRTAIRIVGDELTHARLAAEVVEALGGVAEPAPVETDFLAEPVSADGVLGSIVDSLLRNFLLGETLAVPLFDAMRRHTRHPAALAVLERVLRDEAVHRAFGWDVLDTLLEVDPVGVRARIDAALPGRVREFASVYATAEGAPMTEAELEAGLLDYARWAEVFWATMDGDFRRRLAARGMSVDVDAARVESKAR